MAEDSSLKCDLEDESDVPPLEDMTELIQQVSKLRSDVSSTSCPESSIPVLADEPKKQESSKSQKSFGGFRKGFLNIKPVKAKPRPSDMLPTCSNQEKEIPFIRPTNPEQSGPSMKLPEVQEAMQSGIPSLDKGDWITDDLLKQIERNPSLTKMLMDPKFTAALSTVQTDPKKALAMLEKDPEMQKALKEFSGVLGEHFTNLGNREEKLNFAKPMQDDNIGLMERSSRQQHSVAQNSGSVSAEDEAKMKEILSDNEVMKVLQDPQIQELLMLMKSNPEAAQLKVRSATTEMRLKIKKLVDVGLLGFAS